jgi:hypothetical protein
MASLPCHVCSSMAAAWLLGGPPDVWEPMDTCRLLLWRLPKRLAAWQATRCGGSTNPCTLLLQWLPYAGWAFLASCLGFGSKRSSMTCRTAAEWLWPPSSVIRRAPELIHAAAAAVQLPVERLLWLAQAHAMLVLHCMAHQAPEHHHADGLTSQPPRVAQYVAQYDKRQAQATCREGFRRPIWSCLGQQQCCSPLGVCMRS